MSCHRHRLLLVVLCAPALLVSWSFGYDHIPSNIKTSASPAISRTQINAVIAAEVAKLSGESSAAQKAARQLLVYEAQNHSGVPATPQYLMEYATDLSAALRPLMDSSKHSLRVRLNAAITATEVARETSKSGGAAAFADLDQVLLADKQSPIALWGLKLARYVIGDLAASGKSAGKIPQLVARTAKEHQDNGALIEEAYAALTLEDFRLEDKDPAEARSAAAGAVVPDLLDMLQWRTEQYKSGNIPPTPLAEQRAAVYLSIDGFGAISGNPALKNRTLQTVGNMTCTVLHQIANGNNTAELVDLARSLGGAMFVLGDRMDANVLRSAGSAIKQGVSANSTSATLASQCNALAAALKEQGVTIDTEFDATSGVSDTTPTPAQDNSTGDTSK